MNLNNSNSQKLTVIILSVILFSSIPVQMAHAVGFSFTPQNISNDLGKSLDPQVAASGDDIYVIWRNSQSPINDVYFSNSIDGGTSFSTPTNLSSSSTVASVLPQITFDGVNVYAVWQEGADIVLKQSTNSGQSFESTINLSDSGTTSKDVQISANTNNVYVVFNEDVDVFLSSSTNSGSSFGSPDNFSNSGEFSEAPQISTSGSDAFVVWQEGDDISFIKASESGGVVSLDSIIPLSSSGDSPKSTIPQIASSGSNVFVVWQEGDDIVVKSSTDSGNTFSNIADIGDTGGAPSPNPQIVMSGDNAHVVWSDITSGDTDIMFSSSVQGAAFTAPQNLSDTNGSSLKPQIASSGSNVYVTWRENDSGNNEIIFKGSDDDGATFTENSLSGSLPSDDSDDPQIAISGSTAHVVWEEDIPTSEIFHSVGISSAVSISFTPSDNLKLGETTTITVTNSDEVGSIDVHVKSSTGDPSGFDLSLEKISETHSGTLTFSETLDSSQADRRLKANPGDTITVTFGSSEATTQIISRTIAFNTDFVDEIDSSCLAPPTNEMFIIEVVDENSNTDITDFDTVTVQVTSLADPSGIYLTLTETGIDTGIFGEPVGPVHQLIFYENQGLVPEGRTVTITQEDTRLAGAPGSLNEDATAIDNFDQTITSTSEPGIVTIQLTETGNDTGIFTGELTLSNTASNDTTDTLLAVGGDIITVIAPSDGPDMLALVTLADPSQGAIKVDFTPDPDSVVATLGVIESNPLEVIEFCTGQGGGGGGLVHPSLVVNALAGIGGGGSAYSSPTLQLGNLVKLNQLDVPSEVEQMIYDHDSSIPAPAMDLGFFANFDYPMIINNKGFVLSGYSTTLETQTLEINTPHTIKLMYYEADKIQHFSLYTNLRGANSAIHQSDTQILYNDGKEIQIVDPNGFFENVSFTLNEVGDLKKEIVLDITFAKPMDTSDIILRSWDPFLNSFDTYILDAITVVSDNSEEAPTITYEAPIILELESQGIPIWIKNNAAWWSDQQIGDSDFISGIEYLIKNKIINVPGVEIGASSATAEIPDWIKNNAGWWSESLITDDDFIDAMQWLIGNGVIQI